MALRRFNAGGKKQKAQWVRFCQDIQIDLCGSIFDPLTVKWEFGSFVHVGVPYECSLFTLSETCERDIQIIYSFIYMQIWNDLWFQHMWKSERSKECKAPYQNFMFRPWRKVSGYTFSRNFQISPLPKWEYHLGVRHSVPQGFRVSPWSFIARSWLMNRSRKSKRPLISSILMAQARSRAWLFGKVGSQM